MIISGMVRLVLGTPVVRCVASVFAAILAVCGLVPLVTYPLLRLDASSYGGAIGVAAKECAGDPIPARGGCWSAAPARVTITGVDGQSGLAYVVVDVPGRPATREDFVSAPPGVVAVGTTLTARYWHGDVAELVVLPAAKGAAPLVLPTADNPAYRATQLPVAGAVLLAVGAGGLLLWGRPLLGDVRDWRRRRRAHDEAELEIRESSRTATLNRGLARYGITLRSDDAGDHVELTGRGDRRPQPQPQPQPPTAPNAEQGGKGWSVRPS